MREILFRGKNLVTNEFVIGDLFQHGEQCFVMALNRNVEVDPETVGQFTGLTDKNGKKIFEGDIVRYSQDSSLGYGRTRNGQIKYMFAGSSPTFYIYSQLGDGWPFPECDDIEVIGNVYDDVNLMGGNTNG